MQSEIDRILSFGPLYPIDLHQSSLLLAKDGFYWNDRSGQISCFSCGHSHFLTELDEGVSHDTNCSRRERNISFENGLRQGNSATRGSQINNQLTAVRVGGITSGSEIMAVEEIVVLHQYLAETSRHNELEQGGVQRDPTMSMDLSWRLLKQEQMYLEKRLTCKICEKERIGCIYLSCGCVVSCWNCRDQAQVCIKCGKNIDDDDVMQIYL